MYRRREFIAGSVGLLSLPALAQSDLDEAADIQEAVDEETPLPEPLPGGTLYVVPDGEGDGSSWDNAAAIGNLDALIQRVSPGGSVLLLAGTPYSIDEQIDLNASGGADAPVTITGVARDGAAGRARFEGTRSHWDEAMTIEGAIDASGFGGNILFRLGAEASHLRFVQIEANNFGTLVDLSGSKGTDLVFEDISFRNIRDGVFTDEASTVSKVTLRRFSGRGFSKKGVRFHGQCSEWLVEDCELDSAWQYGDNFAVGIEAHDSAHGLRIIGGFTRNSMDTQGDDPESYWNGDGVASERDNYDIVIEDHESRGHTDSAYDLKSENTTLRNCVASDSKRNYRLWGGLGTEPMELRGCQSLDPHKRGGSGGAHHLWVSGGEQAQEPGGSVIFVDGIISGAEPETAIYADGGNVAVHLVDTEMSIGGGVLFETGDETSVVLIGSADDVGVSTMVTEDTATLVAGTSKTLDLEADAPASWRLVDATGDTAFVSGATLTLSGGETGVAGRIVVQSRDSAGRAKSFIIETDNVENPVAPGAVFALEIGADGELSDATGMHVVKPSAGSEVRDGAFYFRGKGSYFEVEAADNLALDGPFRIETVLSVEDREFALPADLVTVWETSGHERSFRIGLTDDDEIAFFWSTDGRAQEGSQLTGPVLKRDEFHSIAIERRDDGIISLAVNNAVVAETPGPVDALHAGRAPLRVSGRPDGKQAASGLMRSLLITLGSADCEADATCAPD